MRSNNTTLILQLTELLQPLWLSDKEMKIFLILMQYNGQTIIRLSRLCSLPRTTTYSIVERLIDHWLVYIIHNAANPQYSALSFDELLLYIESRKSQMDQFRDNINNSKHLFESWKINSDSTPIINFYKKDEIPSMMWDQITKADYADAMRDIELWIEYYGSSKETVLSVPRQAKILTRRIMPDSELAREHKKLYSSDKYQIKLFNPQAIQSSDYILIEDTIMHVSYEKSGQPLGMVIKDTSFYQMQKSMFESLWDSLDH